MPVIPPAPSINLSDLVEQCQTGDILLFQGHSKESQDIEFLTGSQFSHVGMVLRDPSLPRPMIWQAGPTWVDADANDPKFPVDVDPIQGKQHGGAQCAWLDDTLMLMNSTAYGDTPYWRSLQDVTRSDAWVQRALQVVTSLDGTPFPPIWEMYVEGFMGDLRIPCSNTTLFCGQLVALTWQEFGLLDPASAPTNWYNPKRFGENSAELTILGGASLGATRQVICPAPPTPQPTA